MDTHNRSTMKLFRRKKSKEEPKPANREPVINRAFDQHYDESISLDEQITLDSPELDVDKPRKPLLHHSWQPLIPDFQPAITTPSLHHGCDNDLSTAIANKYRIDTDSFPTEPSEIANFIAHVKEVHKYDVVHNEFKRRDCPIPSSVPKLSRLELQALVSVISEISLKESIRLISALLGIPVRDGATNESLHCLFSLFLEQRLKC